MTICFLSDATSVHTRRWALHFASRGHQVHVVSFSAGVIPGVTVHHLPMAKRFRGAGLLLGLPALRRAVCRIAPSVVHAHYASSYGIAGAALGIRPLVTTAWGSDVLVVPAQSTLLRHAIRCALRRADLVTCVADHMAETMRVSLELGDMEIVVLPFGVDTDVFHPGRRASAPDIDVICTRPCDPVYNIELLIRALPAVAARHPAFSCVLVGGGGSQGEMRQLAESLGVARNVRFAGKVTQDELATLLGRARVFVSPAVSDGNNISLNEAMACRCLPVCSDIAANREWLRDGVNGYLVPLGRPDVMSARLLDALAPNPGCEGWLDHNWELVLTRGNWTRNMERMEAWYRELAGVTVSAPS